MTAEELAKLAARFPKEQRQAAAKRVADFVRRFWTNIRIYDCLVDSPHIDDLIGTDPTTGDTEFLKDHLTPRA